MVRLGHADVDEVRRLELDAPAGQFSDTGVGAGTPPVIGARVGRRHARFLHSLPVALYGHWAGCRFVSGSVGGGVGTWRCGSRLGRQAVVFLRVVMSRRPVDEQGRQAGALSGAEGWLLAEDVEQEAACASRPQIAP